MKKERDLGETWIPTETRIFVSTEVNPFSRDQVEGISERLKSIVLEYNFDTFSFMFELLDLARKKNLDINSAFMDLRINSLNLARRYKGTNCSGLSLLLQENLGTSGIDTKVVPAYGNYLISKEADKYVQIRTVGIIGSLSSDNVRTPIFLIPGLTIDKPILLIKGNQVESFGNRFLVSEINDYEFHIVAIRNRGEDIRREFHFEEIMNLDTSLQLNLLRCRTKYQITRQYEDNNQDYIKFDFMQKKFRVKIGNKESIMDTGEFKNYVFHNSALLETTFRNPFVSTGFLEFTDHFDEVVDKLLLPNIRNILIQSWKSS